MSARTILSWSKKIKQLLALATFFIVFALMYIYKPNHEEEVEKRSLREKELSDMSIPPVLSERMKKSSWNISYWIGADKIDPDCKTAHEYMDERILEKTYTRRGSSRTHSIFEYLGSCKRSAQRAFDQVSPSAKKWCHYRATDSKLEELCAEWEKNGNKYLNRKMLDFSEAEERFKKITNGAYSEQLLNL